MTQFFCQYNRMEFPARPYADASFYKSIRLSYRKSLTVLILKASRVSISVDWITLKKELWNVQQNESPTDSLKSCNQNRISHHRQHKPTKGRKKFPSEVNATKTSQQLRHPLTHFLFLQSKQPAGIFTAPKVCSPGMRTDSSGKPRVVMKWIIWQNAK